MLDGIHVSGIDNPDLRPFDDMMVALMRDHSVPGASLAVSRNGDLVYARGFGYRDVERSRPVLPATRFRIASLSKPITAAAIVSLVHAGKLQVDDTFVSFLNRSERSAVHPQLRSITVRHLLQHRGGWDRDQSFDPMFKTVMIGEALGLQAPANQSQIIQYMLQRPLDFEPGTRYAYSNFGYCLLGQIIERVTMQSYEDYVREQILAPLGVSSPKLARTLSPAEGETRYYTPTPETVTGVVPGVLGEQVPPQYGGWCIEYMDSHGGWIASASDLVAFADAFNAPTSAEFMTDQLLEQLFQAPAQDAEKNVYYGFGWNVRRLDDPTKINTWHTGSLAGTSTLLVRRHDGLNWAVLFNMRDGKDGKRLSAIIDPLVHRAANQIEKWPENGLPSN